MPNGRLEWPLVLLFASNHMDDGSSEFAERANSPRVDNIPGTPRRLESVTQILVSSLRLRLSISSLAKSLGTSPASQLNLLYQFTRWLFLHQGTK